MTLRPRSDWTSTPPANAHPFDAALVEGVCVHWNGPAVPRSALTDPRSYLEGVRHYHTGTKGWSDIAYNLAVDQTGDVWVLRGIRHQSAANGTGDLNDRWLAILGIIGEGQTPTPAMLRGMREAVELARSRYPKARLLTTHGAIRPGGTECPGPDLTAAVKRGDLEPAGDDVTDQDKHDIANLVCAKLLGPDNQAAFRNNVRVPVDAEFTQRIPEIVAAVVAALPSAQAVDLDALAVKVADLLAARLAS